MHKEWASKLFSRNDYSNTESLCMVPNQTRISPECINKGIHYCSMVHFPRSGLSQKDVSRLLTWSNTKLSDAQSQEDSLRAKQGCSAFEEPFKTKDKAAAAASPIHTFKNPITAFSLVKNLGHYFLNNLLTRFRSAYLSPLNLSDNLSQWSQRW